MAHMVEDDLPLRQAGGQELGRAEQEQLVQEQSTHSSHLLQEQLVQQHSTHFSHV